MGLDWAEADRPVLTILKRVLSRGLRDRPLPRPIPIVSVDWAIETRGRAVYAALHDAVGWRIERQVPPKGGWCLEEVLKLAEPYRSAIQMHGYLELTYDEIAESGELLSSRDQCTSPSTPTWPDAGAHPAGTDPRGRENGRFAPSTGAPRGYALKP